MRAFWIVLATAALAAGATSAAQAPPTQAPAAPAPDAKAAAILAAARLALGGDQKLAGIRTFEATGRTRQIRGNNLVPIEFEIWCELPDKYVRRDEIPAQESGPTSIGFSGDTLIQWPPPAEPPQGGRAGGAGAAGRPPTPAGGTATPPAAPAAPAGSGAPSPAAGSPAKPPTTGAAAPAAPASAGAAGAVPAAGAPAVPAPSAAAGTATAPAPAGSTATAAAPGAAAPPATPPAPPPDPRLAKVASAKQDFVRLTLGMFAASFSSYPLTFTAAGQAEAPQGRADIIDVKGPGAFALKLFINSDTHLPIMVSWTTPATNVVVTLPGDPPPENVPPGSVVVTAPPLPAPTAPKEEQEQYAKAIQDLRKKTLASAKPVEQRIYYGDYRDIGNGLMFPFRLRRATAGETIEETNFDEFKTNVRVDPRRFTVMK